MTVQRLVMTVAPLMVPIHGTMLSSVLGDRSNLIRSLLLVITAATAVVAIDFATALLVPGDLVAATTSQAASRVNPGLPDLLGALATGPLTRSL